MTKAGDILGNEPDSRRSTPAPSRKRIVEVLNPRLVNVLTVLGFGLPIVGYFWLLGSYSVNVILGDQFDDLTVIGRTYTHLFDWSALWAQHNENRIFFPNLIVVLMARTTHFDIQLEEYVSATMLVAACFLLIWAHKRRSPATPWLYYCPVALMAFSVVQFDNTLWGFQIAWYLVLLSLATTLALLDRVNLTWIVLVASISAAVVGSFSSLQGLFIWPVGMVLLYHRRRPAPYFIAWAASATASLFLYFHNFNTNNSPLYKIAWHHPLGALKFFLFAVGDVVGFRITQVHHANGAVTVLGLVIVVLAVFTIGVYGIRRDTLSGSPIGVALICTGLLFAAVVTEGRIYSGYVAASASRYTTFDLLIPIGIYLALLGRPSERVVGPSFDANRVSEPERRVRSPEGLLAWIKRTATPVARWAIATVIVVQIPFGLHYGIEGARERYAVELAAVRVLRNINHASNDSLARLTVYESPAIIRQKVRIAERYHLSLFASPSAKPRVAERNRL